MSKDAKKLNLYRIIDSALFNRSELLDLRRLIPIAWPIRIIDFRLNLNIEEELGIVERHFLETLARFGPMSRDEAASFLGLDSVDIDALSGKLVEFDNLFSKSDTLLSVVDGTLNRIEGKSWRKTIGRSYRFAIDGATGRIFPTSLNRLQEFHYLQMKSIDGVLAFVDYTGERQYQVFGMLPSDSLGEASLRNKIKSSSLSEKELLGIPENAIAIDETVKPKHIMDRWILTLGELDKNDRLTIRPVAKPEFTINEIPSDQIAPFSRLLQRNGRPASILFEDPENTIAQDSQNNWENHVSLKEINNRCQVILNNPTKVPYWPEYAMDSRKFDDDAKLDIPNSLRETLSSQYWWHPVSFALRLIDPGNTATARHLLILQGLRAIERLTYQQNNQSFEFGDWWEDQQNTITSHWSLEFRSLRISVEEILTVAKMSRESDVVEFVSGLL